MLREMWTGGPLSWIKIVVKSIDLHWLNYSWWNDGNQCYLFRIFISFTPLKITTGCQIHSNCSSWYRLILTGKIFQVQETTLWISIDRIHSKSIFLLIDISWAGSVKTAFFVCRGTFCEKKIEVFSDFEWKFFGWWGFHAFQRNNSSKQFFFGISAVRGQNGQISGKISVDTDEIIFFS